MEQTFEIVIDQLVADEEFRDSFIRTPRQTLQESADWGLPLCDSEILALIAAGPRMLEQLADQLDDRLSRLAH
jgi:hypothetical protein